MAPLWLQAPRPLPPIRRRQYMIAAMFRFTLGVEEEFQIVDPASLGAAVARNRAARLERAGARRPDQARAAPVDRRGRHEDLRRRSRAEERDLPHPPRADLIGRARRACGRGRRHPSVLGLEGPGPLPGRPLRQHRRGAAAAGAVAADLRPARARGGARTADGDRPDERGALLPAAPAGALDQLSVLDGARHRPEVVPHDGLPPLPALAASRIISIRGASTRTTSSCSST